MREKRSGVKFSCYNIDIGRTEGPGGAVIAFGPKRTKQLSSDDG